MKSTLSDNEILRLRNIEKKSLAEIGRLCGGISKVAVFKRLKRLESFINEERTIIIYESPYRILATLQEIRDILGNRPVAVAREMTKVYEEIIRGTVDEVIQKLKGRKVKGEITLIIGSIQNGHENEAAQ